MKKAALGLVICIGLFLAWRLCESRFVPGPPIARSGIDSDPVQTLYEKPPALISVQGWQLQPLASYQITGRVLAIKSYQDAAAGDLAPYDVAVGWGPMAKGEILEKLDISQKDRFMHWHYWTERPPLPEHEIVTHCANIHVIPADDVLRQQMGKLKVGAVVKMEGDLVEARHPRAEHPWRSSLSREDTGEGACELLYLRTLQTGGSGPMKR